MFDCFLSFFPFFFIYLYLYYVLYDCYNNTEKPYAGSQNHWSARPQPPEVPRAVVKQSFCHFLNISQVRVRSICLRWTFSSRAYRCAVLYLVWSFSCILWLPRCVVTWQLLRDEPSVAVWTLVESRDIARHRFTILCFSRQRGNAAAYILLHILSSTQPPVNHTALLSAHGYDSWNKNCLPYLFVHLMYCLQSTDRCVNAVLLSVWVDCSVRRLETAAVCKTCMKRKCLTRVRFCFDWWSGRHKNGV